MRLILVLVLRSLAGPENPSAAAAASGGGAGQLVLSEGLSMPGAALLQGGDMDVPVVALLG